MAKYQKIKRKKVDRDPRLVKSINKKGDYRGARRSSWWNETSSTVDQVMSLNKAGLANVHTNLGLLLKNVKKDFDGAEAAFRAAIAADPGHATAHANLGVLLENGRGDLDGAEAAYRAAIAADPGFTGAHNNLGLLLESKATAKGGYLLPLHPTLRQPLP